MAWEPLREDYKDAVWDGLKKYKTVTNNDGTTSFVDVTTYSVYDEAFIGAKEANATNASINVIMAMLESGTDLYTNFQNYFINQQEAFTEKADQTNDDFEDYLSGLKNNYSTEITNYEEQQQQIFQTWFEYIKGQLSTDAAGKLQEEIDELKESTEELKKSTEEDIGALQKSMGDTDISKIADGTATGAIASLNSDIKKANDSMTGIESDIVDGSKDSPLNLTYPGCGKWSYYNKNSGSTSLPYDEVWGFGLKLRFVDLFMTIFLSGSSGKAYYAVYNKSWGAWNTI